jgi:hypothetical protein
MTSTISAAIFETRCGFASKRVVKPLGAAPVELEPAAILLARTSLDHFS